MSRTHRDRGHQPPVNGTEERLDALLDVLEDLRDRFGEPVELSVEERPGQVRLREGGAEAEAGEEVTPDPPAARPVGRGGARRGRR